MQTPTQNSSLENTIEKKIEGMVQHITIKLFSEAEAISLYHSLPRKDVYNTLLTRLVKELLEENISL